MSHVVFIVLWGSVAGHQAVGLKLRAATNQSSETVCFSLAAYEEPQYIDALIANFLHFAEPSSKIAIHFDKASGYKNAKEWWASERVVFTEKRIDVQAYDATVFMAHLFNTRQMLKTWPGQCGYWVLQASNMMWVRPGFERRVRDEKFSPLDARDKADLSSCASPIKAGRLEHAEALVGFNNKIAAPKALYGHGQPEGSFFPMYVMEKFNEELTNYLQEHNWDDSDIYRVLCYVENNWLQTFSLNYFDVPERAMHKEDAAANFTPLCRTSIMHAHDSIPIDEVKRVIQGTEKGYKGYYAVKRVERDINHPTTQFIIGLIKTPRQKR